MAGTSTQVCGRWDELPWVRGLGLGMVFGTMKVAEGAFHLLYWKNLKVLIQMEKSRLRGDK